MSSAVRTRIIPAVMLLVVMLAIWWARRKPPQTYPNAYVSDRSAILWNTTAQVRERVTDVKYGERVSVLGHTGDQTQVRTGDGLEGWVDSQLLMAPELWQRSSQLLIRARSMPVQAIGHTRAPSNVHLDPSRTATRVFQFGRNARVVVLERRVVPAPTAGGPAAATPAPPAASAPDAGAGAPPEDGAADSGATQPKQEDWLLVLHEPATADSSAATSTSDGVPTAQPVSTASQNDAAGPAAAGLLPSGAAGASAGPDLPIAGWVLARFIELDPPATVADNASSAGLRIAGWAVLNNATDASGTHPQYLLAGVHGGEGQPCDFTALRVYTWGAERARYETAYVENDVCGQFPIRTSATPDGAEFRFVELDESGAERVYHMKQTIVRRVRENEPAAAHRR